jgi:hypothetical protein
MSNVDEEEEFEIEVTGKFTPGQKEYSNTFLAFGLNWRLLVLRAHDNSSLIGFFLDCKVF